MQDDFKYAPLGLYNLVTDLVYKTTGATLVKSDNDWKVVIQLFELWAKKFPEEAKQFLETVPLIRATRSNNAQSESKEIQYTATLPPRFMRIIKAAFPKQQFDKKFIYKLCLKMPVFKIARY